MAGFPITVTENEAVHNESEAGCHSNKFSKKETNIHNYASYRNTVYNLIVLDRTLL